MQGYIVTLGLSVLVEWQLHVYGVSIYHVSKKNPYNLWLYNYITISDIRTKPCLQHMRMKIQMPFQIGHLMCIE